MGGVAAVGTQSPGSGRVRRCVAHVRPEPVVGALNDQQVRDGRADRDAVRLGDTVRDAG